MKNMPTQASPWRQRLRRAIDLPGHWRALSSQPPLDVVSVRPVRDTAERQRCFADPDDKRLHASGPRRVVAGIHGQERVFNLSEAEMRTRSGRLMGRERVIEGLQWAQAQGAKVVVLPAGSRALFGADLPALRARFPELLLCGGDNGRAGLLGQQLERELAQPWAWQPRVLVLAPYEEPGQSVSRLLEAAGHTVLGWGPDAQRLRAWELERCGESGSRTAERIERLGAVDIVVSASADRDAQLDFHALQQLRRRRRRLRVIDAAEPLSVDAALLARCQDTLSRVDGACARVGGRGAPLPGALAEALALFHAAYRLRSSVVLRRDWFQVGSFHQLLVGEAMRELGLGAGEPTGFGVPQRDRGLQLGGPIDPLMAAPPEPVRPPRGEALPFSAAAPSWL